MVSQGSTSIHSLDWVASRHMFRRWLDPTRPCASSPVRNTQSSHARQGSNKETTRNDLVVLVVHWGQQAPHHMKVLPHEVVAGRLCMAKQKDSRTSRVGQEHTRMHYPSASRASSSPTKNPHTTTTKNKEPKNPTNERQARPQLTHKPAASGTHKSIKKAQAAFQREREREKREFFKEKKSKHAKSHTHTSAGPQSDAHK